MVPLLRAAGHEVWTPTLTGLGERQHLATAAITLDTHVQDIVSVLEYEELHDVVLVGHSYAGAVITGVAERTAERLAHLVYLSAVVPQHGQSVADLTGPAFTAMLQQRAEGEGAGWQVPPLPAATFGVTSEEDANWVNSKMVADPLRTLLQPLELSNPVAAALPRTYIYCPATTTGRSFFEQFAQRAQSDPGWRYRELVTGQDAMVTEPRQLTDLLLEVLEGET
jgi:pimeloyl-ACP methyl ester carboxylesterase